MGSRGWIEPDRAAYPMRVEFNPDAFPDVAPGQVRFKRFENDPTRARFVEQALQNRPWWST